MRSFAFAQDDNKNILLEKQLKLSKKLLKKLRPLGRFLGPYLGKWYLSLVYRTSRFEFVGHEHLKQLLDSNQSFIGAFWHGRLAIMAGVRREKPVYVMISQHGDGEIIARIARGFNKPSVRGSTTRGGKEAFRQLAEILKSGHDAVVTPDGPRGPRQVCQKGVISLAKISGCVILPTGCSIQRMKRMNSWDRFIIPFPFNRIRVIFAPPVKVPENAGPEEIEDLRLQLEQTLNRLTEEADRHFGHSPEC